MLNHKPEMPESILDRAQRDLDDLKFQHRVRGERLHASRLRVIALQNLIRDLLWENSTDQGISQSTINRCLDSLREKNDV